MKRLLKDLGQYFMLFTLLLFFGSYFAGCGAPIAEGPPDTFHLDFAQANVGSANGVMLFLVDGVNPIIFEQMLDEGLLPNIKHYFVDRGLYVRRAVGNTPSVTLANLTSCVTGQYPGHHGITGINWFDRNTLVWRNYETIAQKNTLDGDYITPTIYELLPDRTTFSVFFQPHRSATKFIENWTSAGPPYFFGMYRYVDRLTLSRLNIVIDVARQRGEWPAVTIVYLLAPDFFAYDYGVRSQEYRRAMEHTDAQLGRVLHDMNRAGLLDNIHIALTSDHSLAEVSQHLHMKDFLRDVIGLNVSPHRLWESTSFENRLAAYSRYSTVYYGSGDRYGAICLRKPIREGGRVVGFQAWPNRPGLEDFRNYPTSNGDVDLLTVLLDQEAVGTIAYSVGDNSVRVMRQNGEVEFRQPGGPRTPISYHLISGEDPLGYATVCPAMLDGGTYGPDRWFEATAPSEYPNLATQILAYFRARRAGDIAVFAQGDWDFNTVNRAGHGSLGREDIMVPLLIAGPGIQHQQVDYAQTVDLVPTILDILGEPIPEHLDGRSLLPIAVD